MTFTIALLQLTGCGLDLSASLEKGLDFCHQAADAGADLALFPEMWSIGYSSLDPDNPAQREKWLSCAVKRDSAYVTAYCEQAASLNMAIGLTYLEQTPTGPRNTLSVIDCHGQILFSYSKVHTCAFDWEKILLPGDGFRCADLETADGVVRLGAMICFDREFPESTRVLALQGAEIILTPNACELEANRLGQIHSRAFENMTGVAVANYAAPQENGHSIALDGMAFTRDGKTRDMRLVEAGGAEGVYLARFDLDEMRAYRSREVWGSGYRRPETYSNLCSSNIQ
jgi:N-carbamoylputrescine amidase